MPDEFGNNKKDTGTKLMFGVLVFFGILTLVLGVLQITRTINIGGGYNELANQQVNSNQSLGNINQSANELKSTDMDKDGLSDYDELYIYHTSPYLADSDSDGFSDKEEIDNGFDPNCPKGTDCRGTTEQPADSNNLSPKGGSSSVKEQPVDGLQSGNDGLATGTKQIEYTPEQLAEIRKMLLDAGGISQEQLDKISDEDLIKLVQEVLKEQNN